MLQRLRLASGLVLFTYVATHLLNHSLGLISLAAANAGRQYFVAFWRFPPLTVLLYGALLTHFTLVLLALYRRRHLRLPPWEILRLSLGLLIPALLLQHVFGTRVAHQLAGIEDTYTRQVLVYWVLSPHLAVEQIALLSVAWWHGCLGLHYWLRVKRWHEATLPALRLLGQLVPILAVLGFVDLGQDVSGLASDPDWLTVAATTPPPQTVETLDNLKLVAYAIYVGAVVSVFTARRVRSLLEARGERICLTYPEGRRVRVVPGATILEASRAAGIPHASLCGGRGRCSTCRTRVGRGAEKLPPPTNDEARVLRRIAAPPNVRLACQVRPTADLEVMPLLPPGAARRAELRRPDLSIGRERELAILFADLRAFTALSEHRLPYDVVFLLNQYTTAMGKAIERAGGLPNQFVGDGIMALFGLESEPRRACLAALRGAVEMATALDQLNESLHNDLPVPLSIGIGIHFGQVILGEMGYGSARYLTAVGDVVNTASRLEGLNKEFGTQLVVSIDLERQAEVDLAVYAREPIVVRGRTAPLAVYALADARELESALSVAAAP